MNDSAAIGVIGGSGLYAIGSLEDVRVHEVDTPFGRPSGPLRVGRLQGRSMAFLARHGEAHDVDPTHIPYRANIHALKQLGVRQIISVSAVGSMREAIAPGHLVFVDQFIDRTRHREDSFFGDGCVVHISFADPICGALSGALSSAARGLDLPCHDGGTYLCMEGPAFSTRAESLLYRSWGVSVIGMTNLTEAKLAREAEICYATLALSTDYDCWHEEEQDVSVGDVLATLRGNVANAQRVIARAVANLDPHRDCPCQHALDGALMTAPERITAAARARLTLLLGDRLSPPLSTGDPS